MKSFILPKTICATMLFTSIALSVQAQPTTSAPTPPEYPANKVLSIYSDAYTPATSWYKGDWGDNTIYSEETIDGTSDNVYKFEALSGYFGWEFTSDINTSTMTYLHVDFYSENEFTINVTPICRTQLQGEQPYNVTVKAGEWTQIDIDLAEAYSNNGLDLSGVYQLKFSEMGEQTLWIDNVYFYSTSTDNDEEAPEGLTASLVSASYYSATINCYATDNSGGVNFTIADETKGISITRGATSGTATDVTVTGLTPATTYNFTITASDSDGNICATSVSVQVTTLSLPTAAPTPQETTENVISIYSDAYTTATSYNIGSWGQTTTVTEIELDGNNTYLLENFNYLGFEFGSTLDISDMDYLHIDVYSHDATNFSVTPIWGGENLYSCTPLNQGTWNSFDIPLAEAYPEMDASNIYQLKLDAQGDANGPFTVFIDNIYFYTVETESDEEAPILTKAELAGTTYNTVTLTVAVTDNSGNATIEVYSDAEYQTLVASTDVQADGSDQTIVIENLEAETAYTFYIKAKDAANNYAENILSVEATTTEAPELTQATYSGTIVNADIDEDFTPDIYYTITYNPATNQLDAMFELSENAIDALDGFVNPEVYFGTAGLTTTTAIEEGISYATASPTDCPAAAGETITVRFRFVWAEHAKEISIEYVVGSNDAGGSTDIAEIHNDAISIYAANGTLYINGVEGKNIRIYSVSGQLVNTSIANAPHTTINLERGIYIVVVGKIVKKIII